ncbi:MAG: hypothetical protein HY563_04980, partial [Ignavibacteriales bacterium]|nr:hypothetical protein [Ignavibacteriales bacterium]
MMSSNGTRLRRFSGRLKHLALAAIILVPSTHSQTLSLSPLIDTLNAQLLRMPGDAFLRQKLIDAYTLAFEPELALLEILSVTSGRVDAGIRGRAQFSLEQLDPATRSLRQAYLESPSDETLTLLGVLAYASGNPRFGALELQRLKGRSPSLSVDLLNLYERFYLHGRTAIASAAQRALQDVDPVAFETYFPRPQISILSPQSGIATETKLISVIWEVRHSRPLKRVLAGNEAVYERPPDAGDPQKEHVQRSFTRLVSVKEGRNPIVIQVEDVFGNRSVDTVFIHGLTFDRRESWKSPFADSLQASIDFLRTYVPDSVFASSPVQGKRAMIVAGPVGRDFDRLFHRALFVHELLTNPFTGEIATDNAKLLADDRVTWETIGVVAENWLLKSATFQSVTILYMAGEWRITDDAWNLLDRHGAVVDMRPWLRQLRSLATAGFVLLFDGSIDHRQTLEDGLRELLAGSTAPISAVILPPVEVWEET